MPGPLDPSVKKILNNGGFIAALAPLIEGPEASALAVAAKAYAEIVSWMGIVPDLDGFKGCEQGKLLAQWLRNPPQGDEVVGRADLMNKWTADIWSAIDDLAAGKMPA